MNTLRVWAGGVGVGFRPGVHTLDTLRGRACTSCRCEGMKGGEGVDTDVGSSSGDGNYHHIPGVVRPH